jgi:hypothetical protein
MDSLDQCPAEDDLDFACAVHDFCYGANDYEELFPDEDFECSSRTHHIMITCPHTHTTPTIDLDH